MLRADVPFEAGWSREGPISTRYISPSIGAACLHAFTTVRAGIHEDLDALVTIESRAFTYNRLTRRSFATFLTSPRAALMVAAHSEPCIGYALVLFRSGSEVARLYSLAVDPVDTGRGVGSTLLTAAEKAACRRGSKTIRLEVREDNRPAINLYRKFDYRIVGRRLRYYDDHGNALRLEKRLSIG